MRVQVSVQVFDHPTDVFNAFACSCEGCGGSVRNREAPEFFREMDEYLMFSVCDACAVPYLVVGVNSPTQINYGREVANRFMKKYGSKFGH